MALPWAAGRRAPSPLWSVLQAETLLSVWGRDEMAQMIRTRKLLGKREEMRVVQSKETDESCDKCRERGSKGYVSSKILCLLVIIPRCFSFEKYLINVSTAICSHLQQWRVSNFGFQVDDNESGCLFSIRPSVGSCPYYIILRALRKPQNTFSSLKQTHKRLLINSWKYPNSLLPCCYS